jgi:hypothetical protein
MPANNDMPTSEISPGYLLFFRGKDWDEGLTPEELAAAMDRFTQWSNHLAQSGKISGGHALDRSRTTLTRQNGQLVTDGPYPEAKEAVAGTLILTVATYEEAVAIASSSPALDFGGTIDIRPLLAECPIFKRARMKTLLRGS